MEDMTSLTKKKQIRAMAWDPSSPATLQLPTVSTTSSTNNNKNEEEESTFRVDCTLSHDGAGCNSHETSALMNLLDARDAYLASTTSTTSASSDDSSDALTAVSRAYRHILGKCVQGWENDLAERTAAMDDNDDHKEEEEEGISAREQENLDLLKITFAVTHLSETFLLLPSTPTPGGDLYETTPSSVPGAVTAETVRYLRLHHMSDPTSVCDDAILEDLESSIQPDQLDEGEPYWTLVQTFLVRGCLQDAWALLSRHSLHRQAQASLLVPGMDEYQATTLAQDYQGFRALEALLLSAPLPGGRTDEYDADFWVTEQQQDNHPNNNDRTAEALLEGIPPLAYRLWEAHPSSRTGVVGDFPGRFQSTAALQVYRSWQHAVKGLAEVQALTRRIPPLQGVLALLSGDFSGIIFESWAEEFCAELLYKAPNLRLSDMHIRASRIMEKYKDDNVQDEDDSPQKGDATAAAAVFFNDVVLSVMRGNAGRVVEVLHNLGGGSGAALPAVTTSLLCNLLDDARIIPKLSDDYSIPTELLLSAAFAIRSSLAVEGQRDLGTRLVVRLLLPHIKVDGDVAIAASMVNALEHHYPQTDAEATMLLDLCHKLVERKNLRVLDGCVAICLARYRFFLADERPGGAVHWLLTGMNLEALCRSGPTRPGASALKPVPTGVCHRLLVTICMQTAESLLQGLLGGGEGVSLVYATGKEIVVACEASDICRTVPAVKVLEHIVAMAEAIAERKDDALVASNIVACLEEHSSEEGDGEVTCLARPTMHWDLLRLAKVILDRNVEREAMEELHLHAASFDVRGMQILLEKLTLLLATHDMTGRPGPAPDIVHATRVAFAEGLMRAFVAENSMKQSRYMKGSRMSTAGVYAADLGKVSREKQELVVQSMFDF